MPGREERKLNRELKKQGIDPKQAWCTDCKVWYDSSKKALVQRHKH